MRFKLLAVDAGDAARIPDADEVDHGLPSPMRRGTSANSGVPQVVGAGLEAQAQDPDLALAFLHHRSPFRASSPGSMVLRITMTGAPGCVRIASPICSQTRFT